MNRNAQPIQNRSEARRRMARGRRVVVRVVGVGFTLAELLVAVGVVAILTLGIGRIFGSVSKLVGTGAAVGEVDQIARVIEAQLRADFEAASRLGASENFLAIKNRRVGDLNNNGALDNDEVDIYLTRDDEDADRRRNVDPYTRATTGAKLPISRAFSPRLDQIMFLGAAPEGYRSYQAAPAADQVVPHALIMWGHALRPPLDAEAESDDRPPYRLNYPDGDFGFARSDDNPFAPNDNQFSGKSTGRNRYAGDFNLSRRAILLAGAQAGGEERVVNTGVATPLWGADTEVAFYPRDVEASLMFDDLGGRIFGGIDVADSERASTGDGGPDGWGGIERLPNPRLLRHGRTDILALDREGLQRWIEGVGVPFTSARLGHPSLTDPPIPAPGQPQADPIPLRPGHPNSRLWVPQDSKNYALNYPLQNLYEQNLRALQSGIAGMFHRVVIDPEPPNMRIDPESTDPDHPGYPDADFPDFAKPDPRDRRMDLAAIIASHCSSFEVAWSDGSTWYSDTPLRVDANGDNVNDRDLRRGDTIWFDMDFTYADFWRLNGLSDPSNARVYPRPNPDPEIGLEQDRVFQEMPGGRPGKPGFDRDQTHAAALNYRPSNTFDSDPTKNPAYYPKWNGVPYTPDGNAHPDQEYLAIWGFRMPEGADQGPNTASTGGYQGAWPKPKLIRVRMTLHDSQNRLEGGKQFEFVFRLDGGKS